MALMLYIAVDFNTTAMDPKERVYLVKQGSTRPRDQDVLKAMRPGARVILHDGEMEVEAVVDFDRDYQVWFGVPDWSTRHMLQHPPEANQGRVTCITA